MGPHAIVPSDLGMKDEAKGNTGLYGAEKSEAKHTGWLAREEGRVGRPVRVKRATGEREERSMAIMVWRE